MKKVIYLLLGIFMVGAVGSCTNEMLDDASLIKSAKKGKKTVPISTVAEKKASTPISFNDVTPYIIPGENNGGNRTCYEVAMAWDKQEDYFLCGEKIDYEDGHWLGEFPDGLYVEVDDDHKTLSFSMDECITIEGKKYMVGAVIVKGGRGANVYFYENGTLGDRGLAAPGGKFLVSNLTFCFVECDAKYAIAVKSWFYEDSKYTYVLSEGSSSFDTNIWCDDLGIIYYPGTTEFDLWNHDYQVLGNATIEEASTEGVHSLIITVELNDGLTYDHTYLYVGNLAGITEDDLLANGCPNYKEWPFQINSSSGPHVFTIPFSELN